MTDQQLATEYFWNVGFDVFFENVFIGDLHIRECAGDGTPEERALSAGWSAALAYRDSLKEVAR